MDALLLPRRFTLQERVSRRVVLALDRLTGLQVALKAAPVSADPGKPSGDGSAELAREAELLASLEHPGFPRFVDFGFLADGRAFFAMECATGERPVGPLEPNEVAALIDGTCEALSLLHSRGLIHRDIKPDNVRFDPTTGRVMLLDLGLAMAPGRVRDARGTRGYLAPELLERGVLDARSDLYALGALVYECATGRPAFSGEHAEILIDQRAGRFVPLKRLRPDLPDELAFEIARLLDPDPTRRAADADDAAARLLGALGVARRAPYLCAEPVGVGAAMAALGRVADAAATGAEAASVIVAGAQGSGRAHLLEAWRGRLALSARPMLVRDVSATGPHPLAGLVEDLELVLDMDLTTREASSMTVDAAVDAIARAGEALKSSAWRRAPLVIAFAGCERAPESVVADLAAFARAVRGPIVTVIAAESASGRLAPQDRDILLNVAPLSDALSLELAASALRCALPPDVEGLVLAGGRAPGEILTTIERTGRGRRQPARESIQRGDVGMCATQPGTMALPLAVQDILERTLVPEALAPDPVAALASAAEQALVAVREGDLATAREIVRAGLSRCDGAPSSPERHQAEAVLRGVAALLAERAGVQSEAIAQREMAVECARRSERPELKGRVLLELARLRRCAGDDMAAQVLLAAALDARPDAADDLQREVLAEAADLELSRGNLDECEVLMTRGEAGPAQSSTPGRGAARMALVRARFLARRSDMAAAGAFALAAEALETAGEAGEVPGAMADCARWRESMGDLQGALEAWTESLSAADNLGRAVAVAEARDALAALHARAGRPAEAADHARAAARGWANAGNDESRSQSLLVAGRNALHAGQVNAAVAELQAAARLAGLLIPRERRAELLNELGLAQLAAAEHAEALACCEEALALATEAQDRIGQAKASCALGLIHGAFGSTREGVRWSRRALDLTEALPGATRARARLELGTLFIREGHLVAADRAIRQALAEAHAAGDVATASRASLRLGRVEQLMGEWANAEVSVRAGLDLARSIGDRLAEIEALRCLGTEACEIGEATEGIARLEESLEAAVAAGCHSDLPAAHEALARAHLRLALRLRTPTGVVVDRQRIAIARAHVEKGLDLTVSTGRMADRATLLVLSASALEMTGDPRAALDVVDEAHRLALESGDLLVASRARLVRGEALLATREFGVALAEARIALEAVSRSGAVDDEWRAHALLARVQGAWGMPEREAASTEAASQILRRIAATLGSTRAATCLADAERQAALTASGGDAVRARRSVATELTSERLGGRVDTEDLVEALIAARRLAEGRGIELERTRERLRRGERRRRLLARASTALSRARAASGAGNGTQRSDAARVLAGLARAWGAEGALLADVDAGLARICASHGARPGGLATLATLQRVVDAGVPEGVPSRRRRLGVRMGAENEIAVPLVLDERVVGVLLLKLRPTAGPVDRADFALLEALAPMLAMIVTSPVEKGSLEPAASR